MALDRLDNQDPRVELDIVTVRPRRAPVTAARAHSFGFGGHNVCPVLTR